MDNPQSEDRINELIKTFERLFGETPTTADISYLKLLDK